VQAEGVRREAADGCVRGEAVVPVLPRAAGDALDLRARDVLAARQLALVVTCVISYLERKNGPSVTVPSGLSGARSLELGSTCGPDGRSGVGARDPIVKSPPGNSTNTRPVSSVIRAAASA
jgi:hypothetical protein